ncbi:f-box only protein 8 [Caerostris darwini]|uniref:F-box only protein 8 n=1 Tax=Caerostris darwini TaxID=1538125 RepID=A0AAV4UTW0_9ARAC|nr:f-box only protein 8 [Caerostris darwini]
MFRDVEIPTTEPPLPILRLRKALFKSLDILPMGQVLKKIKEHENGINEENCSIGFPDLAVLPPEISLCVLSHLNATDLCLAACVWGELAQDQILWQSLCQSQWGYASIYAKQKSCVNFSYHHLYLQLDEGTVTFNADAFMGMDYFIKHQLIDDNPKEIAHFIYSTRTLNIRQKRLYLNSRRDVLSQLIGMHNFSNQFLPHALRRFFESLQAPNELDNYLHFLLERFSARFCQCNPKLQLSTDMVYILCFSLIMLSVDLTSPHIKNKMSKREFIRNVRHAVHRADDELFGHMYDDVYLRGHIAPNSGD